MGRDLVSREVESVRQERERREIHELRPRPVGRKVSMETPFPEHVPPAGALCHLPRL